MPTNLIALCKAQRASVGFEFEPYGTKMRGTRIGKVVLFGDSKRTGTNELPDMKPVSSGQPDVVFFNAGEDDLVRLAHR